MRQLENNFLLVYSIVEIIWFFKSPLAAIVKSTQTKSGQKTRLKRLITSIITFFFSLI